MTPIQCLLLAGLGITILAYAAATTALDVRTLKRNATRDRHDIDLLDRDLTHIDTDLSTLWNTTAAALNTRPAALPAAARYPAPTHRQPIDIDGHTLRPPAYTTVEAALIRAGRPLSRSDIQAATNLTDTELRDQLADALNAGTIRSTGDTRYGHPTHATAGATR